MKPSVQDAVNDQIQAEFASAYLYLAMSAHFESINLSGFAHWLHLQWQEETAHAMKLYQFLLQRGGRVVLKTIDQPRLSFTTPTEAFEAVLAHEQHITERIDRLYELAVAERDYPLQTLLHWFINEQVEEEQSALTILERLRMIGEAGSALFLLDRQLATRTPDDD